MDLASTPLDVPAPRAALDVAVLVRRTQALLAAGVPLTLLIDLADDAGPHSRQRYAVEGGEVGWVRRLG